MGGGAVRLSQRDRGVFFLKQEPVRAWEARLNFEAKRFGLGFQGPLTSLEVITNWGPAPARSSAPELPGTLLRAVPSGGGLRLAARLGPRGVWRWPLRGSTQRARGHRRSLGASVPTVPTGLHGEPGCPAGSAPALPELRRPGPAGGEPVRQGSGGGDLEAESEGSHLEHSAGARDVALCPLWGHSRAPWASPTSSETEGDRPRPLQLSRGVRSSFSPREQSWAQVGTARVLISVTIATVTGISRRCPPLSSPPFPSPDLVPWGSQPLPPCLSPHAPSAPHATACLPRCLQHGTPGAAGSPVPSGARAPRGAASGVWGPEGTPRSVFPKCQSSGASLELGGGCDRDVGLRAFV